MRRYQQQTTLLAQERCPTPEVLRPLSATACQSLDGLPSFTVCNSPDAPPSPTVCQSPDAPPPLPSVPPPELDFDSVQAEAEPDSEDEGIRSEEPTSYLSPPASTREELMRKRFQFLGLKPETSQEYSARRLSGKSLHVQCEQYYINFSRQ